MRAYDKGELFLAMYANLDADELRVLAAQLAYNPRLDSLRYRKLWLDTAQTISDILELCERRGVLLLLIRTLQERFPYVLDDAPVVVAAGANAVAESLVDAYSLPILSVPTYQPTAQGTYTPAQMDGIRRNLAWQAAQRAERRAPLLDTATARVSEETRDDGILSPINPLHWLLVIWWFIFEPRHLRQYRAGLNVGGEMRLREAAMWGVNSLAYLPLAVLWLWAGVSAPQFSTLEAIWAIPLVITLAVWLGVSLFTPLDSGLPPQGAWVSSADVIGLTFSIILGMATAMLLSALFWDKVLFLLIILGLVMFLSAVARGLTRVLDIPHAGSYAAGLLNWLASGLLFVIGFSIMAELPRDPTGLGVIGEVVLYGCVMITVASLLIVKVLLPMLRRWANWLPERYARSLPADLKADKRTV